MFDVCFATLQRESTWGPRVRSVERPYTTLAVTLIALVATATVAQATASSPEPRTKSQVAAPSKAKPKPIPTASKAEVKSSAFLVVDEENADVLLAKKADTAMPIASITKLMTALVVLDAGQPMDEMLKITADDRKVEPGSRLVVGTSLTRSELLRLALMSSENRAANAVGRNYPGGIPGLLRAMNAKAKSLGMNSARFADATGLSIGNVASPRDLVKLVAATSRNETIREYSTDTEELVTVGKHLVQYRNTNLLVHKPDWNVVVQKTGFTNAAGQCLVMKAIIEDRPVVMVLMNSFGKYTRVADARRVRKWLEAGERLAYNGAVQAARAK
jgi:serine-type D-Ala-D-Ala endopeptidase (penicillin-binding protein 7)